MDTFLFYPTEKRESIQIKCFAKDLPILKAMGFVEKREALQWDKKGAPVAWVEPEPEAPALNPPDGDKGHGSFNSPSWHKAKIAEMTTKKAVSDYTKEVTGVKLEARGGKLDMLKQKAFDLIEQWDAERYPELANGE